MGVLIGIVAVLFLAEIALVTAVFVSPNAAEDLRGVGTSISRGWNGAEGQPGFRTRVAQGVSRGYDEWITPLWADAKPPQSSDAFADCATCHKRYAKTRRYPSVYMNHPLHAELGVACETCHTNNTHPNPERPREDTCVACHTDVEKQGSCTTCHPPGALPHFYLLGAPRDAAVECNVCHPATSFGTRATTPKVSGTYTGDDPSSCLQCHAETNCASCHAESHPANWPSQHGIEAGQGGLNTCYTCHTGEWCGTRCHSVTTDAPFTKQPLPDVGVRP
jgi:cytochrome c553